MGGSKEGKRDRCYSTCVEAYKAFQPRHYKTNDNNLYRNIDKNLEPIFRCIDEGYNIDGHLRILGVTVSANRGSTKAIEILRKYARSDNSCYRCIALTELLRTGDTRAREALEVIFNPSENSDIKEKLLECAWLFSRYDDLKLVSDIVNKFNQSPSDSALLKKAKKASEIINRKLNYFEKLGHYEKSEELMDIIFSPNEELFKAWAIGEIRRNKYSNLAAELRKKIDSGKCDDIGLQKSLLETLRLVGGPITEEENIWVINPFTGPTLPLLTW